MSSKAEYLKKYLSNDASDKPKKKKKSSKPDKYVGMRLIEDDAFIAVEAAKQKDIGSDEEREEIEVLKESVKKARINPGFKQTFSSVQEVKKEIKEELVSPDQSPPRTARRKRHDSDESPKRRKSPSPAPRRKRHDSDNSPIRNRGNDSDNSPPRRNNSSPGPSRRQRNDSDNSPVRRNDSRSRKRHDSDNSPPRRKDDRDSDVSPPRKQRRRNDSDNSPPRMKDRDNSPPRRNREIKKEIDSDDDSVAKKTLDGKKAGLQSARDLKEEGERIRRKEAKMFDELDSTISGRNAETVYRTKQTKRRGAKEETEEEKAKKERENKKTEELKEKYKGWNRGVAQISERQAQLEEMARVAAEPMARRKDDEEMNRHLKEVLHEADPMANVIRKKRRETAIDRGELVYPTYNGTWTPNRFGIPPGYRWDGVDRSNGFEGRVARTDNQKAANQSEYYKSIAEYE
ncbi:unnamed protein product [Caenorhabditis angaria]|uniref:BUD13 homolog n=1 Tax=Caenorhabditis angaria TaxID=860376 RepID=A0A9P1IHM1_9PELO|nr:unnamed protein product [Caenorhabditis angaria]